MTSKSIAEQIIHSSGGDPKRIAEAATFIEVAFDEWRQNAWRPIDADTPRDEHILLIGTQRPHEDVSVKGEFVFSGYWDEIDGEWCSAGSTWNGPFYDVRAWQPLPRIR